MNSQAPVHRIRIGAISCAVWVQDTDKGRMYNTTFNRSYRVGNDWKESASFGSDALGTIAVLATGAALWIASQVARDRAAQQGGQSNDGQTTQVRGDGAQGRGDAGRSAGRSAGGGGGVPAGGYYSDTPGDYPPY